MSYDNEGTSDTKEVINQSTDNAMTKRKKGRKTNNC